jgi:arylsulfatase A-like enzyme
MYFSNEYSTAVMGNASVAWLTQQLQNKNEPFFMTVAPHAPHEPYTPAPWYVNATVPNIPYPRHPWLNHSAEGHVPWLAALPPLTHERMQGVEFMWFERFRALMAVDDVIREVINLLAKFGELDNTYVFFTSDHGHHLGEFRLPEGKEHCYEFDIRVPFAVRGPGVPKNKSLPILTSNVDLGPTFIELAGGTVPPQMDGQSFAHYLTNPSMWLDENKDKTNQDTWNRQALIIEYYTVANWTADYVMGKSVINDCPNNTWRALRFVSEDFGNLLYVEYTNIEDWWFQAVNFYELYDIDNDPFQLTNIYYTTPLKLQQHLHDLLVEQYACGSGGSWDAKSNCTLPFPNRNFAYL